MARFTLAIPDGIETKLETYMQKVGVDNKTFAINELLGWALDLKENMDNQVGKSNRELIEEILRKVYIMDTVQNSLFINQFDTSLPISVPNRDYLIEKGQVGNSKAVAFLSDE